MAVRVSVIIPAYNEADVIADTIRGVQSTPGIDEIIVVDDGSTDDTANAAHAAGAGPVITLNRNKGKGGALNKGLSQAKGEILLLLDADLGASSSEAEKLLKPVLDGDADMTIAVFCGAESDNTKLASRSKGFGTAMKTARFGIKALTGKRVTSPLAGQRALKREIIERAGGFESKFGVEVGLTIDALRMGYRIIEVPVHMVHRASGRDIKGFMHRGRQMSDILRILCRKALRL